MKKIVVLSGAGISVESGISTFRDTGGLWEKHKVEDVATPEGYQRNQKLVIDFYNTLRKKMYDVEPCDAHRILAELEDEYEVVIVTQNVDDLHERAGSSTIIHLHGEMNKVTSSWEPNNPEYIKTLKPEEWEVKIGDLAADGSQLRPYIVWFNEPVPNITSAVTEVLTADIFIIIGTSMNVYPAAGLIEYLPNDCDVYLIDPNAEDVKINLTNLTVIKKSASDGMREFLDIIKTKTKEI